MSRNEFFLTVGATTLACCILAIVFGAAFHGAGASLECKSLWFDIGKTAMGTLFGAAVAFASFLVQRRLQLRREDLIAANMTLFKLRAMQRKALLLRKMVRHEVSTKVKDYGNVPTWSAVRPLLMSFESDLTFDLEKLAFLVDTKAGQQALKSVRYAEDLFADLRRTFEVQQSLAQETQHLMVEVYRADPNAPWDAMEEALGPHVISRGDAFFRSLLQRVEQDPFLIADAFALVRAEFIRRFGDQSWEIDFPLPDASAAAQPPLPDALLAWLAQLPQD